MWTLPVYPLHSSLSLRIYLPGYSALQSTPPSSVCSLLAHPNQRGRSTTGTHVSTVTVLFIIRIHIRLEGLLSSQRFMLSCLLLLLLNHYPHSLPHTSVSHPSKSLWHRHHILASTVLGTSRAPNMSPHAVTREATIESLLASFNVSKHGFLPAEEPLKTISSPYYEPWELLIHNLQGLLDNGTLRKRVDSMPVLSTEKLGSEAERRRAYVILTLLTHSYVWGGDKAAEVSAI